MTVEDYRVKRERLAELQNKARGFTEWVPWTPAQTAPVGDWYGWLFLAGRGTGKTDAGSNYVKDHVAGPPCIPGKHPHRVAIIAPTLGDAIAACVEGETGILTHDPTARKFGTSQVKWSNGSVAQLFGTYNKSDVERLRAGGNRCLAWLEELAAWPQLRAAYEQLEYGLRSGDRPHWIGTTTGKPRKLLMELLSDPEVVRTSASTADNPHLPAQQKARLIARYEGTRRGRQELHGEIVFDVEGAIWSTDDIESYREPAPNDFDAFLATMDTVFVGVDPPGGATECGIVAVGRKRVSGVDHFYPLLDRSLKDEANKWAQAAITTYKDAKADGMAVEVNYGGDMVRTIIDNNLQGGHIPIHDAHATRGKKVRAEPVHDLYQQGRVHHVGRLEKLEEEMTTWVPEPSPDEENPTSDDGGGEEFDKSKWSPNRLDALVWAITYLAGFNEPTLWFA